MLANPRFMKRWQVGLLLLMLTWAVSACSLLEDTSDEPVAYDGPPVVTIAAPLLNDTYQEGVGVNILVRVENAGPDIARVAISVDGQIIGDALLPNPDGAPSFTVRNGWPATGVGQHVISVSASRADGTMSTPASVNINVVAGSAPEPTNTSAEVIMPTVAPASPTTDEGQQVEPTQPPAQQQEPTNPPEPTEPPPPTQTPTPSRPQVRIIQGANVRSGASTAFNPPIGSLAAGAVNDALAVSPDGQWYKIRYYNGDGWVYSGTAEQIGDFSSLPREAGPPTPVPFTPTPVPTATPVTNVDLSITNSATNPFPLECGQSSEISITVTNTGTGNSSDTTVVVEDLFNGQVIESTSAPIGALAPNESASVFLYLTVSTNVLEEHVHRIRIDPEGRVAETNEGNNVEEYAYSLASGSC